MTANSSVNARLQLLPAVDVSDGQAVRLTQGNSNSKPNTVLRMKRLDCGLMRVPSGFTSLT